jgi:hypothetical protein
MSPVPSEGVEDIQTPLALRAALGMTPLVENGARLKTHSTASRRPSVDPLQRCKGELQRILFQLLLLFSFGIVSTISIFLLEGHRFNGHNGLEKADSNKIKDKRCSQEVWIVLVIILVADVLLYCNKYIYIFFRQLMFMQFVLK